jgi:microcystin-dependent protein
VTALGAIPTTDDPAQHCFPPGVIMCWPTDTPPTGWLLCNGQAVSRTGATAALFAVCGIVYGAGDGVNTFNVPDLRGRMAVGKGSPTLINTLGKNDGLAENLRTPGHRHGHRGPVGARAGWFRAAYPTAIPATNEVPDSFWQEASQHNYLYGVAGALVDSSVEAPTIVWSNYVWPGYLTARHMIRT